jgi:hypothetical protein
MTYHEPKPEERCQFKDVAEKWRKGCHNKATSNGFCYCHGGVAKTMLTPAELKLIKHLLGMAADEFSNHGCNDFQLRKDAKLTDTEAREVVKTFEAWVQKEDPKGDITYDPGEDYLIDWLLMKWLASKVT